MAAHALERMSDQRKEKDEFGVFGEYVASELRSLPPAQGKLAKLQVVRALNEILEKALLMVCIFISSVFHLLHFILIDFAFFNFLISLHRRSHQNSFL